MANKHTQTATQIIDAMQVKRKATKLYTHVNTGFFAELGYTTLNGEKDGTITFFLQYTGILTIDCSTALVSALVRSTLYYLGVPYDEVKDYSTNTVFKIK